MGNYGHQLVGGNDNNEWMIITDNEYFAQCVSKLWSVLVRTLIVT